MKEILAYLSRMGSFSNWSGSVQFTPAEVIQPSAPEELQALVRRARETRSTLRVVGAGHSFTPLVESSGILVNLDRMQGVTETDVASGTATVKAGTRLYNLGEWLHERGLAMENLGDINQQSLAGAVSTGTHGTGLAFGNIATQITELEMLTASGDLVRCSEKMNPELYFAARVSLGALGIITSATLRLLPSYRLEYKASKAKLEPALERLDDLNQKNRHFEMYWFPFSETVQLKETNLTDKPAKNPGIGGWFNDMVMENGVFWALSKVSRLIPGTSRGVSKVSAWGVSTGIKVNYSHKVFATPRHVRFNEMEYALPAAAFLPALREIKKRIETMQYRVHFPLECRWSAGDAAWLSPAHGRDTAYIAVHQYKGMKTDPYFRDLEAILRTHGGRPHWGKMHTLTARELAALYPKWDDFNQLRRQMDPEGIFLNNYLKVLFGE